MKLEAVIKKTVCKAEGYFDINPTFYEPVGCLGCSFFHVCRITRGYKEIDAMALNEHINKAMGLE